MTAGAPRRRPVPAHDPKRRGDRPDGFGRSGDCRKGAVSAIIVRMTKSMKAIAVSGAVWTLAFAGAADEVVNGTCFARWDETSLTVGNAAFSRVFVAGKGLRTRSWQAGRTEWIDASRAAKAGGKLSVTAERGRWSVVGEEGVKVVATVDGTAETIWILPGMPGVLRASAVRADAAFKAAGNAYADPYRQADAYRRGADTLPLAPLHVNVTAFELVDQTDMHNELCHEKSWLLMVREAPLVLSAPIVALENSFTGEGVLSVRLAPLPTMRPERFPDVVACANGNKTVFASVRNGYPVAELAFAGGRTGRIRALRDFQRALRAYRPGRDGIFLTNTWGDSNRDARINAGFMMAEVEAGGELGVDVIQIDDGWQKGKSANSALIRQRSQGAWGNFRAFDPDFWTPDPVRFPQGLKPIVDAAKARGLGFGLWFGPDSSDDCGSWNADAQTLLDFYRTLGVKYFKIDSLKMHSRLAIENQRKMFDRMLAESHGEMTFDLDVTGMAPRPGYLGMPDIGPLFVENRYWKGGRYWPHQTLRNVWSLARVLDPVRLRMEVLNPLHGQDQYPESPLAPRHWRGDALFATVMVASPLGWFEISELAPETLAQMKPLVARWKRERANLHGGFTVPVAAAPDGVAWTGFVTQGADGQGGYALFFREANAASSFVFDLQELLPQAIRAEVIGGRGTAKLEGTALSVDVPLRLDYVWVKLWNRQTQEAGK
ncbi:MAG: hypothetical protein ACI4Q3_06030 [Kiritimatiellia bacterium]